MRIIKACASRTEKRCRPTRRNILLPSYILGHSPRRSVSLKVSQYSLSGPPFSYVYGAHQCLHFRSPPPRTSPPFTVSACTHFGRLPPHSSRRSLPASSLPTLVLARFQGLRLKPMYCIIPTSLRSSHQQPVLIPCLPCSSTWLAPTSFPNPSLLSFSFKYAVPSSRSTLSPYLGPLSASARSRAEVALLIHPHRLHPS